MKKPVLWLTMGAIVLFCTSCCTKKTVESKGVLVLCGGSMRDVLEEIVERYSRLKPEAVVLPTYGGSGELCAQMQLAGKGDLYICHDPFMKWAAEKGLIEEWQTLGYLDVVIVVPKGNPKRIGGMKDLARKGLRIGIGDTTYSTSGVMVKEMFARLEEGEKIMANVRLETKGHQQRCTDVALGALDAAIVWYPVALLFKEKLDVISISSEYVDTVSSATYGESDLNNVKVCIGITPRASGREEARDFYEFVIGNRDVFRIKGFRIEPRLPARKRVRESGP